ncbi:MAG: GNAT family N-acetyltransferase [Gammaproteobacteria bacterium]|nr:GNAT family N-acetyltransferase [Gammaproteobacteria bacterium]
MWHQQVITDFSVKLVPLQHQQLELLRQWRNDPIIAASMLQQHFICEEMQQQWFERVQQDKCQAQFVIYYKDEPIGACNLKSANGTELGQCETIESGFYLAHPRFRGTLLAFFPALALNQYCFKSLNCKTLLAHVKLSNNAALRFNEKLGYCRHNDNVTVQVGSEAVELAVMTLQAEEHQQAVAAFTPFVRS